jgi:hypothetical protein
MRERAEQILRIACLILAALVLCQLVGMVVRWNPFRGVTVPALPALAVSTNAAGGAHGTNPAMAMVVGTNRAPSLRGTNNVSSVTNAGTNLTLQKLPAGTNAGVQVEPVKTNAVSETNAVAQPEIGLNGTNSATGTNSADRGSNALISTGAAGTNAMPRPKVEKKIADAAPVPDVAGMNPDPSAPSGKRGGDLPPAIQAQISRITDSEILGPVIHPLPMGLTGIAGDVAFLRTATGQTGLVKEGDSLGDIKLLRIGINRVLIEQDGQKKELTIFSGYGSDSLLPIQKDTSDETNIP